MKRIIIIEGNVSSLSCHCEEHAVIISRDKKEVLLDITPEAADQIGASFREPMRVVVEIGEADIPLGGLKNATTEDLVHALAAARHAADEYQRENESLSKRNEGLRADLDTYRTPFDTEMHLVRADVVAALKTAHDCCSYSVDQKLIARLVAQFSTIDRTKETP